MRKETDPVRRLARETEVAEYQRQIAEGKIEPPVEPPSVLALARARLARSRRSPGSETGPASVEQAQSAPPKDRAIPEAREPKVGTRPSRLKPFWPEAKTAAMTWLNQNGYPLPGDGGQTALEHYISEFLERRGHAAGESTLRGHVGCWIKEFRQQREAS
jgi:hypothetical protein